MKITRENAVELATDLMEIENGHLVIYNQELCVLAGNNSIIYNNEFEKEFEMNFDKDDYSVEFLADDIMDVIED